MSVPVAVGVIYFAAATLGVMAFVVSRIDATSAWIVAGLITVTMVVGGVLLLTVSVYPENNRGLDHVSRREPKS